MELTLKLNISFQETTLVKSIKYLNVLLISITYSMNYTVKNCNIFLNKQFILLNEQANKTTDILS